MTYEETLERWAELDSAIKKLKDEERALREGLFNGTFPNPTEGVNKFTLPDGRIIKGTYKLTRKLDVDKLNQLIEEGILNEEIGEAITVWKADLDLKAYRAVDPDGRNVVDQALEIKPGLPSLEIVLPKKEESEAPSFTPAAG